MTWAGGPAATRRANSPNGSVHHTPTGPKLASPRAPVGTRREIVASPPGIRPARSVESANIEWPPPRRRSPSLLLLPAVVPVAPPTIPSAPGTTGRCPAKPGYDNDQHRRASSTTTTGVGERPTLEMINEPPLAEPTETSRVGSRTVTRRPCDARRARHGNDTKPKANRTAAVTAKRTNSSTPNAAPDNASAAPPATTSCPRRVIVGTAPLVGARSPGLG